MLELRKIENHHTNYVKALYNAMSHEYNTTIHFQLISGQFFPIK